MSGFNISKLLTDRMNEIPSRHPRTEIMLGFYGGGGVWVTLNAWAWDREGPTEMRYADVRRIDEEHVFVRNYCNGEADFWHAILIPSSRRQQTSNLEMQDNLSAVTTHFFTKNVHGPTLTSKLCISVTKVSLRFWMWTRGPGTKRRKQVIGAGLF